MAKIVLGNKYSAGLDEIRVLYAEKRCNGQMEFTQSVYHIVLSLYCLTLFSLSLSRLFIRWVYSLGDFILRFYKSKRSTKNINVIIGNIFPLFLKIIVHFHLFRVPKQFTSIHNRFYSLFIWFLQVSSSWTDCLCFLCVYVAGPWK